MSLEASWLKINLLAWYKGVRLPTQVFIGNRSLVVYHSMQERRRVEGPELIMPFRVQTKSEIVRKSEATFGRSRRNETRTVVVGSDSPCSGAVVT